MKRFISISIIVIVYTLFIFTIPVATAHDLVFFGGVVKSVVNEPITVSWDAQEADGYELKILHFFYSGLETDIVETTDTSYTFDGMPRSSRHFEIQVRSYNGPSGSRTYSDWSSSTDAACSVVGTSASGWIIYTTPSAPSW